MNKSLQELALLVGGKIKGDASIMITGVAKVEDARQGDITFAVSQKFLLLAEKSRVSAVVVPEEVENFSKTIIRASNPRLAFARILEVFAPPVSKFEGIHPSAIISQGVKIGKRVSIGPLCIIDEGAKIADDVCISGSSYLGRNVSLGERSFLHPRVTLLEETSIGRYVVIHSGTVIGSDGFGFVKKDDGSYHKVPQIGRVVIEDEVEIGANVTIDRATTGETRVGRGTKIDNLVHIAHNVTVGKNVAIVALVGISGSSRVGDGAVLAGQVGILGHLSIGANSIVGAKSGVNKDVPDNSFVWGIPARDHLEQKKIAAVIHKLPELLKRVQNLEKLLKEA